MRIAHATSLIPLNASAPGGSCLPPILYATAPSSEVVGKLRTEIAVDRSLQASYFANAQSFVAQLATAAARICNALGLQRSEQPDILLTPSRSWWTIDRRYSDNNREIVFLSRVDTLPNGSAPPTENMLFAILAHELGHAYQFVRQFNYADSSMIGRSGLTRPIREIELHADFMAGFSLARAEEAYGRPEDLLRRFSDTILNLGDYNFAPCLHHGTPAERYTLMMKGYIEAQRSGATTPESASHTAIDLLDRKILFEGANPQENPICNY